MVTKAIIEAMVDRYNARVRIPTINMYGGSPQSTRTSDLYVATICCPPGMIPSYQPGDIVFVDFEDGIESKPVIMGALFKETGTGKSNMNLSFLSADVQCVLSKDTSIGDVSANDIDCLKSSKGNIQGQIDLINQRLDKLEEA